MDKVDIRSPRTRRWLASYPRSAPIAIFLLIAAITALSVFAIERGESRREDARLNETAKAIASAIERRGNTSSAYLRAGAALFGTVKEGPPGLFRRFVSELRLDTDYRGAEGIGWAEAIAPSQLAEYERAKQVFEALITRRQFSGDELMRIISELQAAIAALLECAGVSTPRGSGMN